MKNVIRCGLAGGLAAALALAGNAEAQGPAGAAPATGTASPREGGTAAGSSATPGAEPSGPQAMSGEQGKVDKGLQEKLEKIHAANEAEVHLAQVASEKAESPEVKQFADQIQADHQGLGQKLTQAAQSAGISSLEGKTYQKEHERKMKDVDKLQSKTGTDFDKEFMSRVVKNHEKSVKATESAAKDARKANRTELASFLENASSGMKGHLEHAKQLERSLGEQGRRPATGTGSGAPPAETGASPRPGSSETGTPPGAGGSQ